LTPILKKKKFIGLCPDFVVSDLDVPVQNLIIKVYMKKKKVSYIKPENFTGTLHLNFNEGGLSGVFEEEKILTSS
jgi:hypothetical protein